MPDLSILVDAIKSTREDCHYLIGTGLSRDLAETQAEANFLTWFDKSGFTEADLLEAQYLLETPEPSPAVSADDTFPLVEPVANSTGDRIAQIFTALKHPCTFQGAVTSPAARVTQYRFMPADSVSVNAYGKFSDDLVVRLGLAKKPIVYPIAGALAVEVAKPDFQPVPFAKYVKRRRSTPFDPLEIEIGTDLLGNIVKLNLSNPASPHVLIAGTSGSGKSSTQEVILLSAMSQYQPAHLKFLLIDLQKVNFAPFAKTPWLWDRRHDCGRYNPLAPAPGIITDGESARQALEDLQTEQERRETLFCSKGVRSLEEYNRKSDEPLPRLICFIEETRPVRNAFVKEVANRKTEEVTLEPDPESFDRLLTEGAEQFRKFGIHFIVSTQYPYGVIKPAVRECLSNRLAGFCVSELASKAILEDSDAARFLTGAGDFLLQVGGVMKRTTIFYIKPEDSSKMIALLSQEFDRPAKPTTPPVPVEPASETHPISDTELAAKIRDCEARQLTTTAMLRECFSDQDAKGQRRYQTLERVITLLGRAYNAEPVNR